jgi:uncharacterized protein
MPEYLSPAVYMEEVSSGNKPIEGVGTSTGAFVGLAVRGPVNTPTLITNPTQFLNTFGGLRPDFYLGYGVRNFFGEGGTRCYVVRAFAPQADHSVDDSKAHTVFDPVTIRASSPGTWGEEYTIKIVEAVDRADREDLLDPKFRLIVGLRDPNRDRTAPDDPTKITPFESFDRLSLKRLINGLANPNFIETRINGSSAYIEVEVPQDAPADAPPLGASDYQPLANGLDSAALAPVTHLIGQPSGAGQEATGLHAFDKTEDINIVAIPDLWAPAPAVDGDDLARRTATMLAFAYCEDPLRRDCFFIADPPHGLSPTDVLHYKQGTDKFADGGFNTSFGALYYPWIYIADPATGKLKLFPPSSSVAGVYSATDVARGVHKAPAGTENGHMLTAVGLERVITKGEHDTLNPLGINVIRKFNQAGIVVWGARTLSADPEWRYVNVRRLFIFIEQSILRGTQWVVFEPNNLALWASIRVNVSAFLRPLWQIGALFGEKPEQAFFVKCDAETNPQESIDAGRVITKIGIAPTKPAEFVIFRIQQIRPGETA